MIIFIIRILLKCSINIVKDIYDFVYSLLKGIIDFIKSIKEYKLRKWNINISFNNLIEYIIEYTILFLALLKTRWRFKGTWIIMTIIIVVAVLSLLKFSVKLVNYLTRFAYSLFKELIDFGDSIYNFFQGILQIVNIVI